MAGRLKRHAWPYVHLSVLHLFIHSANIHPVPSVCGVCGSGGSLSRCSEGIPSSFATFPACPPCARSPSSCILLHLGSLMDSYCFYKVYFFVFVLRQGLLMCSLGLPGTYYVDGAGPELRRSTLHSDPHPRRSACVYILSTGVKACATTPTCFALLRHGLTV